MWVFNPSNLVNDGQWHSYEYEFTAPWFGSDTVWLALEQAYGPLGTAHFDNVRLRGPNPDTGVCCVGEECLIATEQECAGMGGVWHPEWDSCGPPNPCGLPHVCCVGEECFLVLEEECAAMQGVFHPEWDSCGPPNPCEIPSPNQPESWGGVKDLYR